MTSISVERDKLAAVGLRLRWRSEWNATFNYTTPHDVDEPADHQFIHISVTNAGNYSSNDAHVRAIEAIALSRGFSGISYNRLILPGGRPYEGQPIGRRGAHTINDDQRATCNTSGCPSIGRSLRGGGSDGWNLNWNARSYVMARNCGDTVADVDIDAIARCLAADRLAGFVKRDATIHGHRCCSSKSCPCDPTWGLMDVIADRMFYYVDKGNVNQEEDMAVTDADADKIAERVWTEKRADDGGNSANPSFDPNGPDGTQRHLATLLLKTRGDVDAILKIVKTLSPSGGGGVTEAQVRAVVRDELSKLGQPYAP